MINITLGKYKEALDDFNKAIVMNSEYASAYYNRGIAKVHLNDKASVCEDFKKAKELGWKNADDAINQNCNK
jgi:tetratricopeptide (TPR) repeat protein